MSDKESDQFSESDYEDEKSADEQQIEIKSKGHAIHEGISKEIFNLPDFFSLATKKEADLISQEIITNGYKIDTKLSITKAVYYCLYQTLLKNPVEAISPNVLAKLVGLDKKQINAAFKIGEKDRMNKIVITFPKQFLLCFMKVIGLGFEHYETLCKVSDTISRNDEIRNDTYPQNIACGIVFYYVSNILKSSMSKYDYAEKVGLSQMTIHKLHRKISSLLSPTMFS